MITQFQVYAVLAEEIPQLAAKAYPSRASLQIFASINYFTDYTKHAVEAHNFHQAKKCFAVAEKLYLNGDSMVRLLIENSFMYTLFSFNSMSHTDQVMVKSIIPETLFAFYLKQAKQLGAE